MENSTDRRNLSLLFLLPLDKMKNLWARWHPVCQINRVTDCVQRNRSFFDHKLVLLSSVHRKPLLHLGIGLNLFQIFIGLRYTLSNCINYIEYINEGVNDTNNIWRTWNGPQRFGNGTGRVGNRRTNRYHPNYSIVKSSENQRRDSVTQIRVKYHQLTLVR